MVRLGGAASPTYISVFRGLQAHFLQHGIELDWVLYSDYDALVEAFVRREIDLAWNAPLAYVKIKRRLQDPCQVVAMRDVDVTSRRILSPKRARVLPQSATSKASGSPWEVGRQCRPGYCRTISCNS
jgi:hypothetical protein